MAEFADVVKRLRLERGLSQQEVATALKLNKQTISQYERGVRKPNFELAEQLADFFNVDLNYLLGFTDKVSRLSGDPTDAKSELFVEMTTEETAIIRAFRHADDRARRIVKYALMLEEENKR